MKINNNGNTLISIEKMKAAIESLSNPVEFSPEENRFRNLCFLSEYGTKESKEAANHLLFLMIPKFPKSYF